MRCQGVPAGADHNGQVITCLLELLLRLLGLIS